jgi:hypothetical protein
MNRGSLSAAEIRGTRALSESILTNGPIPTPLERTEGLQILTKSVTSQQLNVALSSTFVRFNPRDCRERNCCNVSIQPSAAGVLSPTRKQLRNIGTRMLHPQRANWHRARGFAGIKNALRILPLLQSEIQRVE